MARWKRMLRHALATPGAARRAFPPRTLQAIDEAIRAAEARHGGEIRFVVETDLALDELWRDVSPRQRAIEVFGETGAWDTESNNGVLLYVLLADRDVEIVADRGYRGKVQDEEWERVCTRMENAFRDGRFEEGTVEGIAGISQLVAREYPAPDRDELTSLAAGRR